MPRLHNSPTDCGCIFLKFNYRYLEVMFLYVVVAKGAQFDQFDWPRKLRSQVSIYNIDYFLEIPTPNPQRIESKYMYLHMKDCMIKCIMRHFRKSRMGLGGGGGGMRFSSNMPLHL